MEQEQVRDIQVVNVFFRGKGLTKVVYKGREACVAQGGAVQGALP